MANLPSLEDTTDLILGKEFLTWLWFRSESHNTFTGPDGKLFSVHMEQRVVVQGGDGDMRETASVSGPYSELREARLGLSTGKQVTRALLRLEQDPEQWQLNLKAEDFSFNSLKTPKVDKSGEGEDDIEAIFLEKIYLIEHALGFIDTLFKEFLKLRLGPKWAEEVSELKTWLKITGTPRPA